MLIHIVQFNYTDLLYLRWFSFLSRVAEETNAEQTQAQITSNMQ